MTGTDEVLVRVALLEAGLALAVVALVTGHAATASWRTRHLEPRLRAARATVDAKLDDDEGAAVDAVLSLPVAWQIRLLADLARALGGDRLGRLSAVARRAGLVARAERWCRRPWWGRRLRGARLLTALDAGERTMPALLGDRRPQVRAQAAEWAGARRGPELIAPLIGMLDDPETVCRFAVKDALLRIGAPVVPELTRHLSTSPEGRLHDALDVATGVADPGLLEAALRHGRSPDPDIRAKSARLLTAIGGRRAVERLTELLEDEAATVRAAAAAGVGRLGHWHAASALHARLADRSWDVRLSAATALRSLGAPGQLLLRRALAHPDPFARDMARHVLGLPGAAADTAVSGP